MAQQSLKELVSIQEDMVGEVGEVEWFLKLFEMQSRYISPISFEGP